MSTSGKRSNRRFKVNALLLRDGNRCHLCGTLRPARKLTLDHILPKSHGGLATVDNLKLACLPCNSRRGNLPVEEARRLIANQT